MAQKPIISIVTPSYNMLPYLKRCHASIIDQNVALEHVVADGDSTDGTLAWLKDQQDIISIAEKDNGMYNALNKAIKLSRADLIGHLNCDEQYLPGVLAAVVTYFDRNPDVDFVSGDFIVIDKDGEFIAFRKNFQPRWQYFFSNYLYTTTCTLFFRRKIFEELKFDESYRSIADAIFIYHVMIKGYKGAYIRKYFSAFTYSGENLSLNPISVIEKARFKRTLPVWYKALKPIFFLLFFIERMISNVYNEKSPMTYSIYRGQNLDKREVTEKENPGFRLKFKSRIKEIES